MRAQRFVRRVESFKIPNKVQVRWPIESLSRRSKISLKGNRTKEQWVEGIRGRRYNEIMIISIIQYTRFGVPTAKMPLIFKKHGWKKVGKPQEQWVCDEVPKSWAPGAPFLTWTPIGAPFGAPVCMSNGMRDKEKWQKWRKTVEFSRNS